MALRIRRGTSVQRTSITPVSGELIFDTTQNKLYVGNGSTAGGLEVVAGSIGGNVGSNINLNNFDIVGTGNINITGTITASGTITGNGDLVLGNADTDNVQFGADINSNIVPNASTLTVGTSAKPWQTVFTSALENNAGITSNSNMTLNGLLTIGNNIIPNTNKTKDLGTTSLRWRTISAETLTLENIQITDNNIRTTNSNSNINIIPSGTGILVAPTTKVTGIVDVISDVDFVTTTRVSSTGIELGLSQTTSSAIIGIGQTRRFTYTQIASATQETFTALTYDTAEYKGIVIQIYAANSQGAEVFTLTGVLFSGTVQLSSKQNSLVNSSGVSLIDSASIVPAAGSFVDLRLTTTNLITSGVVTTLEILVTSFRA